MDEGVWLLEQWYIKRLITNKDNVEANTNPGAERYQKFANDGATHECQKRSVCKIGI